MKTRREAEEIYRKWKELLDTKLAMGDKVLELLSHPDVEQDDAAEAALRYQHVVKQLRTAQPKVVAALEIAPVLQRRVIDTKL